ncbi:MAG: hypothetical protein GX800_11250, partial [Clostridiaceae bacterium]|nr:hypothetical protein [Clostridiaceae bacterium]
MINWVLDALPSTSFKVVIADSESIKDDISEQTKFVFQKPQEGILHTISQARNGGQQYSDVLIINGDMPLITNQTLKAAYELHTSSKNTATILTATMGNYTDGYRIVRDKHGSINKVITLNKKPSSPAPTYEISPGAYFIRAGQFYSATKAVVAKDNSCNNYFKKIIEYLIKNNEQVGTFNVEDNSELMSINDRQELSLANEVMRMRIIKSHMKKGVTFISPETAHIGGDVVIVCDTIIMPNTIIQGKTTIGKASIIGPNSNVVNCLVGDNVEINCSVVMSSKVGNNTHIGPFAYIRPACDIGENFKIGDFVEEKDSVIKD